MIYVYSLGIGDRPLELLINKGQCPGRKKYSAEVSQLAQYYWGKPASRRAAE